MTSREDPDRARPEGRRPFVEESFEPFDRESMELTLKGPRIIRHVHLRGVGGSDQAKLDNALNSANIPKLGSPHPILTTAIVGRIRGEFLPNSPSQVKVEIEWGFFAEDDFGQAPGDTEAEASIEVSSSIQPATTSYDVHNQPIILEGVQVGPVPLLESKVGPPALAEVDYQLAMTVVTFRKREEFSPGPNSKLFVGKINATAVFGDAPHMWLCTRITGRSDDRGNTWNTTYEFQRHPDNWDVDVIYAHPETGKPISNPIDGRSRKTNVQVIPSTEFRGLPLREGDF